MPPAQFTFRPSVPNDIPSWLALVPHEIPLDSVLAQELPAVWAALLADEAIEARTIVSRAGGRECVDAFGASVFLRPGQFEQLMAKPRPRLAEWFYRALIDGQKPHLSGRELARCNSGSGVDVCVLHFCERPVDLNDPVGQQLLAMGHAAFRDAHLGYNVRSIFHETFRAPHRAFLLAGGMAALHDFPAAPASLVVGMTRERSLAEPAGSPISMLFRSERPTFYFSASERRVLRSALSGRADTAIAAGLGVTHDAVKMVWRNVFGRVDEVRGRQTTDPTTQRRRQLLDYLRQHPEELRPFERPSGWPQGSR